MKKVVLSFILIVSFAGYTLYTRITGRSAPVALTPEPDKPKVALTLPKYSNTSTQTTSTPPATSVETQVTPTTSPTTTPIQTPATIPTSTPTPVYVPPPIINTDKYKNGTYTGDSIDAYYGYVQVSVTISNGKIADIQFLDYPQGRSTSVRINSRAMPYLISETIAVQDSNVDGVSGASFTSKAYRQSLESALSQART